MRYALRRLQGLSLDVCVSFDSILSAVYSCLDLLLLHFDLKLSLTH